MRSSKTRGPAADVRIAVVRSGGTRQDRAPAAAWMQVALLAPWFALAGCGGASTDGGAHAAEPPARVERLPSERELTRLTLTPRAVERLGIATAPIERIEIANTRRIGGDVVLPSDAVRLLTAPVASTVTGDSPLPVVGGAVAEGDMLAVLTPVVPPDALANLRAATATAEGEVERARVRLELATIQRERTQRLLEQGATSTRLADEARAEFDSATAALAAAKRARDVLLDATPTSAGGKAAIEIRAPFAGIVRRLDVSRGQELAAGTALVELIDPSRVWLRVPIHVGELPWLDPSAPVVVSRGGERFLASPVAAPPAANPLTATADLFYELGASGSALRPGERVEVEVRTGAVAARDVVPWSAVVFDAYGGAWVYVAESATTFVRQRVDVERVMAGGANGDGDLAVLLRGPGSGGVATGDTETTAGSRQETNGGRQTGAAGAGNPGSEKPSTDTGTRGGEPTAGGGGVRGGGAMTEVADLRARRDAAKPRIEVVTVGVTELFGVEFGGFK
jgi:cobalt-zinc-cadmium efflux system membrane fusion protein